MVGKRAASNGGGHRIAGSGLGPMGKRVAASGSSFSQEPQRRLSNKCTLDDEPDLHATATQIQISSPRVAKPRILHPCFATAAPVHILSPGAKPRSSCEKLQTCSAAEQVRLLIDSSSSWGAKAKRSRSAAVASGIDWANLGDGPASLIAERVLANEVSDYIRFRAVCRPWRRCCDDPRSRGVLEDRRFLPRRWIMLPAAGDTKAAGAATRRQFLNTSTGQCVHVDVPELRDHVVLRCTAGLLVLLHPATGRVRLLNPITRQTSELPAFPGLENHIGWNMGTVGLVDDDRTIVFIYFLHYVGTLARAKPGDERWTLFSYDINRGLFPSVTFAGRLYGISNRDVMVLDTGGIGEGNGLSPAPPPRVVPAADLSIPYIPMTDSVHLVDNDGELMVVHRMIRGRTYPDKKQPNEFRRNNKRVYKVYRVNLAKRKLTRARGLGGRAVFFGKYRAISVSPQVFPSLDGNTVYPGLKMVERGGDEQVAAYHLRDGSIDRVPARPWSVADCLAAYVGW